MPTVRMLLGVALLASLSGCMCVPAPGGVVGWPGDAKPGTGPESTRDALSSLWESEAPDPVRAGADGGRTLIARAGKDRTVGGSSTPTPTVRPPVDRAVSRTSATQETPPGGRTPVPSNPPSIPALPKPPRPAEATPLGSAPDELAPAPAADIRAPSIPTTPEYPIDLPTALRLAERQNPVIGGARARIGEALGNQLRAYTEMLPALNAGVTYDGHVGNLQQSPGTILNLSRQSLYFGGGAGVDAANTVKIPAVFLLESLADAIYDPLAAHQLVHVARADATATTNTILMEVAEYYLRLLGATARLEAERRTADEAEELMRITERYARTGEGRPADFHRAQAEWRIRRGEVRRAEEDVAVASARLCHRLHLDPSVRLRPLSDRLEVLSLVDLDSDTEALIRAAIQQRPEVHAATAGLAEREVRARQEVARPLLPTLWLGFSGGAFGGGSNRNPPLVGNFAGRTDFDVMAYWTLLNSGFGNFARVKERRAQAGEAAGRQARAIAMVRREVASALGDARARREQVEIARNRLETSIDGFRRDLERSRQAVPNAIGHTPRPIEVINSLKLLNEARRALIRTVVDYDEAQFRLFVSLGSPPPLEQPVDPERPPVDLQTLAGPVIETPAANQPTQTPTTDAAREPSASALADAESGLARTIEEMGRDAGPASAGPIADLARAHQKSMEALIEYDRLQEALLRSLGDRAATSKEHVDRLLELAEAHRKLLKSKVEYDETLWGLVRTLGGKDQGTGKGTAPAGAETPITRGDSKDTKTSTR